jgi:carboxyl-terminal processing protease
MTLHAAIVNRLAISVLCLTSGCASTAVRGSRTLAPRPETLAPGIALATFDSVWTVVARTYVDTGFVATRWGAVRDSLRPRATSVTTREGLAQLLSATVGQIPDSHFYIIPANVANDVKSDSDAAGSGDGTTGASIRIAGDRALVWRVEPGSPGALAGISPGQTVEQVKDRVARAAIRRVLALPGASRQRALAELDFKLNGALSPAVGDTVHIRVVRPGENSAIERALVGVPVRGIVSKFGNLPPIAGLVRVARIPVAMTEASERTACVGTIAFNIWLPALAPELQRAVDSVADCAGIVLDVRGNPGGVGAMVMGFGGFFVEAPVSLGTMRTRDLSLNFVINPRRVRVSGKEGGPFKGPVAILVDPMTASTSEIFATGMQRIGRARVFGERSAGAALPALMQGLPSGDVFVHAVADFTDPSGHRIEGAGVLPDEVFPVTEKDLLSNVDAPLEAAIRWIATGALGHPAALSK